MTFDELLKKPVELVLENNISEDIVRPSDSIARLTSRVGKLLNSDVLGFLIVYTDDVEENFPVKAVITYKELDDFLPLISNNSESFDTKVDSLALETKFPAKYFLTKTDTIDKAYELFRSGLADIIIILDENKNYIGKVKLKSFIDRIKLLIS